MRNLLSTTLGRFALVSATMLFISMFLFSIGAFGETRFGITLRTNPDLENGLVAHFTFDGGTATSTGVVSANGSTFGALNGNGSTTKDAFTSATAGTSWVVPSGVTTITVKLWGAGAGSGGGAFAAGFGSGGAGGGGGYATCDIVVTPGETLTVMVGGLGAGGLGGPQAGTNNGAGGGGGGYSAIKRSSTILTIAGGGGGGGGGASQVAGSNGGPGGAGGGSSGVAGSAGAGTSAANGGGEGTSVAGGAGGTGTNGTDGTAGSSLTGGVGGAGTGGTPAGAGAGGTNGGGNGGNYTTATAFPGGGGGGGGGLFGGGGGEGGATTNGSGGGAGGGSSDCPGGTSETLTSGSGTAPGNTGDADYVANAGVGGSTAPTNTDGNNGNPGRVVVSYDVPTNVTTAGVLGQALSFDGTDDYVSLGDVGSGIKTIAFWFNTATTTFNRKLINIDGIDQIELNSAARVTATSFPAATVYVNGSSATTNIATSTWYHVVITDSTGVDPTSSFELGRVSTNYFGGKVDDVRVYSRVLSQTEIERLYHLGATTRVGITLDSNSVIQNGLTGHWTLDGYPYTDISQVTAEVRDSVGSNHGDWKNHATTTLAGPVGQGIKFDGSDDGIELPSTCFATSAWTISGWIYPDAAANNSRIFQQGSTGCAARQLLVAWRSADNRLEVITATDGANTDPNAGSATDAFPQRTWTHFTWTFDGSTHRIYSNGAVSSGSLVGTAYGTAGLTYIGRREAGSAWSGALDDFRIYNRALSASEVKRLYELGATTRVGLTLDSNADNASGLVGHWTLDGYPYTDISQVTAEVRDSVSTNHGNWVNHATSTVPGVMGQALELDGSNDYVSFGDVLDFDGSTSFTIAAWINPDNLDASFKRIVSKRLTGSPPQIGYNLALNGNVLQAAVDDGVDAINTTGSSYALATSTWTHAVMIVDRAAQTISLYKDGALASTPGSISAVGDMTNSNELRIGSAANGGTFFDGRVDDVRVYNRTLSASEIERLYELGR